MHFLNPKNLKLLINLNKWFGLKYEALYFYNVYGRNQIAKGYMSTVIGIFEDKIEIIIFASSQTRHLKKELYSYRRYY